MLMIKASFELFTIVDQTTKVTLQIRRYLCDKVFGLDPSLVGGNIVAGVRQQARMAESNATNRILHNNRMVDSIVLPRIESQLPLHHSWNNAGPRDVQNRRKQPLNLLVAPLTFSTAALER
jgi:hypothetical protein